MDNIAALGIPIITGGETTTIRRLTDNTEELRQRLIDKHRDLFENNHTVKELEVRIHFKPDHKPVQQKGTRIPIQLQKAVTKELKKLINAGHLTSMNDIKQDNFISPTVITVKKDNSVKLAMDARILNDNTIRKKAQMPILEELLGQVTMAITKNDEMPLYSAVKKKSHKV